MSIFVKNLHFPTDPYIRMTMSVAKGSADFISALLHKDYKERGVQVQVSKAVSDDLDATDFPFDASVADIPWLGEAMEFYYHDPLLPSMLMTKLEGNILVGMEDTEMQYCTLNMPTELQIQFIIDATAPSMKDAVPLTDEETATMHRMYLLALKVMAFASIPKFKPTTVTRKQMHHGGKPGVHQRPPRPAFQVLYLPKVLRERDAEVAQASTHLFKGRRGHIHHYRSDKFVNRKGTWDYLPPIINPLTKQYPPPLKTLIKVRKVG